MKKRLLLLLFAALSLLPLYAYDFKVDGIYYNINSGTSTCSVTYRDDSYNSFSGDVVIPTSVTYNGTEYSVTSIGYRAFYGCSSLTSVTIPNSVTEIGESAFEGCNGLTSVEIPNSVTSIGNYAFEGCTALTNLIIEDGETILSLGYNTDSKDDYKLGDGLFYDCPLETLYLGRDLSYEIARRYGYSPFYKKTSLKEVTIGNSVKSIGNYAFWGCSGLTSVTIGNSVTYIGNYAFEGCTALTNLIIEDGETTLSLGYNDCRGGSTGEGLFYNCPVKTLYLGRNLSYETRQSYGYSPFYSKKSLKKVTIGNSVTEIGKDAFYDCSGLNEVHISDLAAWCKITFKNAYSNPLTYAHHLFLNGEEVKDLVIPNSVTKIGNYAFNGCTALINLIIEDGETTLSLGYNDYYNYGTGKGLFYDCPLETLYLGRTLSYKTGQDCGYSPFYSKKSLKKVTIGNSVTKIGNFAFNACTALTNLIIEDGETTLSLGYNNGTGEGLFYDCPLETLYLGRNLNYQTDQRYGYSPFYGKESLTELTIGNSATEIGDYAFYGCSGLTGSLTIPNSVTTIGNYAFYGYDIHQILSEAVTPPEISYDSFSAGTYVNTLVTIPSGTLKSYQSKWSKFKHLMDGEPVERSFEITQAGTLMNKLNLSEVNNITSLKLSGPLNGTDLLTLNKMPNIQKLDLSEATIVSGGMNYYEEDNVKYGTKDNTLGKFWAYALDWLEEVKLPKNLVSLGTCAFLDKTYIKEVAIPATVTSIGDFAFNGCTSLTNIIIEDGESTLSLGYNYYNSNGIGKGLFYDCPLETLYLGRNLSYSYSPFKGKESLKDVTIGNTVMSISDGAFDGCSGLTSVSIGNSVTYIGDYAFDGCRGLKEVHISDLAAWCKIAFVNGYSNPLANAHHLFLNGDEVKDLVIPNSVTEIGLHAFDGCSGLTSVTIPNSVTSIGEDAFRDCSGLKEVHISDLAAWCKIYFGAYSNPLCYAHHLFLNGDEVKDLVIPNSVTSIGRFAFYGCSSLTSVTIPNSVTEIDSYAFDGCSGPKEVHISDLAAWCKIAFGNAYSNPLANAHHLFLNGDEVKDLVIPNSVTEIGNYAFSGCSGLTSVEIPNSVTSIGRFAFYGCSSLTSLTIKDGGTILDLSSYSFDGCSIKTLYLGRNVSSGQCFAGNSTLTSLTFGNLINSIDEGAFKNCSGLTSVVLPMGLTSVNESVFENCKALASVTIPGGVRYIRSGAFKGCSSLESVNMINPIPAVIEEDSFDFQGTLNVPAESKMYYWIHPLWSKFPELEAWNVGSDVDFAENSVTYHITSEESATVEITAATLMARAAGELTVPETVEFNGKTYTVAGVANDAFRDMNFATIELPQTIAYVGLNAFSGCKSLNSLTVNAQMPPSVARESFDDGVYGSTTLIIPEDSREDYENHEIWGLFAKKDIVGIEGVDSVPSADAEIEVYNLKGMKVGESLEGLAKGVYIVRQGGKSTKVAI